jgi:hypothetical protein
VNVDLDSFKGRAKVILGGGALVLIVNGLFELYGQATLGFMVTCFGVGLFFVTLLYGGRLSERWFKFYLASVAVTFLILAGLVSGHVTEWTPSGAWGWRGAGTACFAVMAGVAELFRRAFGRSQGED